MKKTINGKTYNTKTACVMGHKNTQIGGCEHEIQVRDTLYCTMKGDWFRYVRKYEWEVEWDNEGKDHEKTTLIKEWIEPLTKSDVDVWWIV